MHIGSSRGRDVGASIDQDKSVVSTLERVRRWLAIVLLIGILGTGTELLLLEHTDGVWQLVPVGLLATSLVVLAWFAASRGAPALRSLRLLMALFVASGAVGAIQHLRANVRDERESNPSVVGSAVFRGALMGSIPALAPGAMVQLGLIGLLFTYRHPRLSPSGDEGASFRGLS